MELGGFGGSGTPKIGSGGSQFPQIWGLGVSNTTKMGSGGPEPPKFGVWRSWNTPNLGSGASRAPQIWILKGLGVPDSPKFGSGGPEPPKFGFFPLPHLIALAPQFLHEVELFGLELLNPLVQLLGLGPFWGEFGGFGDPRVDLGEIRGDLGVIWGS